MKNSKSSKAKQSKSRADFQIKRTEKKVKSMRDQGEDYPQVKKRITAGLTPDGQQGANDISEQLSISRSELFERIGRGILRIEGVNYDLLSLAGKGRPESSSEP